MNKIYARQIIMTQQSFKKVMKWHMESYVA